MQYFDDRKAGDVKLTKISHDNSGDETPPELKYWEDKRKNKRNVLKELFGKLCSATVEKDNFS